jgi:hypothetical protein
MSAILKKVTVSFLLLCLAAPVFFYASFVVKQHNIRHSMKKQLKQQLLQTITVAKNSLVWFDDGKEVSINGKMFDVLSVKEEGRNLILTGLYDTDEDKLHDALNRAMNQKNKQQPFNNWLIKIFSFQADSFKPATTVNMQWVYINPAKNFYLTTIPSPPLFPLLQPPKV